MNKNILINKDGQQLGPYSVEDAKSLVLSGHFSATDWAWTDGATDWVPLNHIPGFSTPTHSHAPANVTVTTAAPASSLPVTAKPKQAQAVRVPCPHCREPICPAATICPFCQSTILARDSRTRILQVAFYVFIFIVLYFILKMKIMHDVVIEIAERIMRILR